MIVRIQNEKQAEDVLRALAATGGVHGSLVFDINPQLTDYQRNHVPLVFSRCFRCDKPSEYCGWSRFGTLSDKGSMYCRNCWHMLTRLVTVDHAMCGAWRTVFDCDSWTNVWKDVHP